MSFRTFIALALMGAVLGLGACTTDQSVLSGGTSLTASIPNPANKQQLAAAESTYNIAANAALVYRSRPLCKTGTVETLENICARRSVVVKMQTYDRNAYAALKAARTFVRNNPTISAVSIIAAAQRAVSDYQSAAQTNGVQQ